MGGAKEGTDLLGKYNPGLGAQSFDIDGSAKFVPKGSDIVFNIHYTSIGTPQTTDPGSGWCSRREPPKPRYWMSPGTPAAFNLVIPAGDDNAEVVSEVTVGVETRSWSTSSRTCTCAARITKLRVIYPTGETRNRFQGQVEFRLAGGISAGQAAGAAEGHAVRGHRALRQFAEQQVQSGSHQDHRWGDQNWDEMQSGFLGLVVDRETNVAKSSSRRDPACCRAESRGRRSRPHSV